jgi:hypothetical protein
MGMSGGLRPDVAGPLDSRGRGKAGFSPGLRPVRNDKIFSRLTTGFLVVERQDFLVV